MIKAPKGPAELGTTIEELRRDVLYSGARQLVEKRMCGGCRAQSQKLLKLACRTAPAASWKSSPRQSFFKFRVLPGFSSLQIATRWRIPVRLFQHERYSRSSVVSCCHDVVPQR